MPSTGRVGTLLRPAVVVERATMAVEVAAGEDCLGRCGRPPPPPGPPAVDGDWGCTTELRRPDVNSGYSVQTAAARQREARMVDTKAPA
jgi:hypothetical protein